LHSLLSPTPREDCRKMGASPSKGQSKYGFTGETTAKEVVLRLREEGVTGEGQVILVTGTTHGIGMETVKALAVLPGPNVTLVLANRNIEAGKEQEKELMAASGKDLTVHHLPLDLSDFASIRSCAAGFKKFGLPLHVVILNAGVALSSYGETKQGIERTFGINHVGHFLLTQLLLDDLKQAGSEEKKSRVVVVASHSHDNGKIDFDDLPLKESAFATIIPCQAPYAQSKLCNVLFANELHRRMQEEGSNVTASSLHPASMTLSNIGNDSGLVRFALKAASFFTRSLEQAAATSVTVALSPELEGDGGKYFDMCVQARPLDAAEEERRSELAGRLWSFTEDLIAAKDAAPADACAADAKDDA